MTRSYEVFQNSDGSPLFEMGEPTDVLFFCEGRLARRYEVMASIDSGLHFLMEAAKSEGDGSMRTLERRYEEAKQLVEASTR
jgi:hypothetical protein